MDKLLESLIAKAKLECEEAHRQLLFSFNGLFLASCFKLSVKEISSRTCIFGEQQNWGECILFCFKVSHFSVSEASSLQIPE